MKKVLIIGGASSICDGIIPYLENNGYQIDTLTHRFGEKKDDGYNWLYLDLMSSDSVQIALEILPDNYYDLILCTPTYNSGDRDTFNTPRIYLVDLFGTFIVNYLVLLRGLCKKMSDKGHLVFITSQVANRPSDMADYAAGKGALQTYVMSLSTKMGEEQVAYSISPAVIRDSTAHKYSHPDEFKNVVDQLVGQDEIARVIVEANKEYNGKIVELWGHHRKNENGGSLIHPEWYDPQKRIK